MTAWWVEFCGEGIGIGVGAAWMGTSLVCGVDVGVEFSGVMGICGASDICGPVDAADDGSESGDDGGEGWQASGVEGGGTSRGAAGETADGDDVIGTGAAADIACWVQPAWATGETAPEGGVAWVAERGCGGVCRRLCVSVDILMPSKRLRRETLVDADEPRGMSCDDAWLSVE